MGLWYLDCFQHTHVILIKACDSLQRGLLRCIRTLDSSNPRILPTTGPLDANLHPIILRLPSQHLPHGHMQAASQAPVRLPRASGWDSQGHGTGEQATRLPGFPFFHRLGRLKVLTWSYLLLVVSGTCTAFALNFSACCVCRFLSGMAVSGASSWSMILSEREPRRVSSWGLLNHKGAVTQGTW